MLVGDATAPFPLDANAPFGALLFEAFPEAAASDDEEEVVRVFGVRYRLWRD